MEQFLTKIFQNDLNRLRVNILRFVDNIKSQDLNRRENLTIRAVKDDYKRSIARIKVIDALKDNDTGLTLKEIHDKSGLRQPKVSNIFTK